MGRARDGWGASRAWFARQWAARERERTELALWSRAMAAGRATSSAWALLVFMAGFTLDDLHLFRFPALYVGMGLAIVAIGIGPPIVAAAVVRRARADAPEAPGGAIETAVTTRRFVFGTVVIVFVAWLVLFASGVTPQW